MSSTTTSAFASPEPLGQRHGDVDPHKIGHGSGDGDRATGHGSGGPSPKAIVVSYGFWIFILSDIIMFAAFFAAYAVLQDATAGGPSGADLFERGRVGTETTCLLASSFTCGLASVALRGRRHLPFQASMAATGLLGLIFLSLEIKEFSELVSRGAGPTRSAFLSAFFTLVGCHGLHVAGGLIWLATMMAQVLTRGFPDDIVRRTMCFSLFWHALDIVWIGVFTVVYLIGLSA